MNLLTSPLHRLWRTLLAIPLRLKISLPYLILTTLLLATATYMVSRAYVTSLEDRFRAQLADAASHVADEVIRLEEMHLQTLRSIAYTEGLSRALQAGDLAAVQSLALPQVANNQAELVEVLDLQGKLAASFHVQAGGVYAPGPGQDFSGWAPVRQALEGEADSLGDKYAGIYPAQSGPVLYTVGPVRNANTVVGAILVGSSLPQVVERLEKVSLADLSIYTPQGRVAAASLAGWQAALPAELLVQVQADSSWLPGRAVQAEGRGYIEALGALYLRGAPSGYFLGVTLPEGLITENSGPNYLQLVALLIFGTLTILGIGALVTQIIAAPISRLVGATRQVAEGQLDVQVSVLAQDEIGFLAQGFNKMVAELRQREFVREMFGRMVSEDVREAVLHGQVAFGGESRQVAVLFTDIRGFTSLAEKTAPQEIIQALNDFFTVVAEATKQHHGIINQFGGDSVLVVFGAPIQRPQVESVSQAIQAAVDIRLGVTRLNARRLQQGQIPIRYGIGINCGQVIAGNLGVQERFEYTVIGDVVNVAARLQGLSRSFPQTPILITAEVLAAAPESLGLSYGDLGEFELKGKARPVSVHSVLGPIELQAPVFQNFSRLSNPVVNAMLACSLYCLGYRQRLIAECLQVPEDIVYTWLVSAHQFQEQIAPVLVGHFGVSPAHANWLHIPPEPVGLRELVPSGTTV